MPHSRRLALVPVGLLLGAIAAEAPASAANPVLRHQEDLHGDVVVFGSTLGYDCGSAPPVPAGASCAGQINVADTAPDIYWRDGVANASIAATAARTSATLTLPPNATVKYARLYWAALNDKPVADVNATIDFLGGPQAVVTADKTWVLSYGFASHPDWYYYQSSGDATSFVSTWGAGDFRVSDVEAIALANVSVDRAFSAWTLVVFYENAGDSLRNLTLFDSFTPIDPGMPGEGSASATLSGFLVPPGFKARMTAFAYEGDFGITGDHFTVNGTQISNGVNPADDFFNSSRSYLGAPVSGTLDVPKLSGAPGSMAGYDLDTAEVTGLLSAGDTSALIGADSSKDIFFLGGFVTSVDNLAPDFHGMTKTAVDLNGGALIKGDVVEYTISAVNGGNDPAVGPVITDVLAAGLTLVPGSIEIVKGGVVGLKTDAPGDDQGDYDAASRTVTWRVGAGADAGNGGTVGVGETVMVRFRATVTASTGTIANQATLSAQGQSGAPPKTYQTDGDPASAGDQPTTVTIDECNTDAQCSGQKPHCLMATHSCEACMSDADCSDPMLPACEASGACGQCSATNSALCTGATPICNVNAGVCVLCTLGAMGNASKCQGDPAGPLCVAGMGTMVHCGCLMDGDCGSATSGKICDSMSATCTAGCRGAGGNGCPAGEVCSSGDTSVGHCTAEPDAGGGTGGSGAAGTGGSHGVGGVSSGGAPSSGDKGGCSCSLPADRGGEGPVGLAALAALLAVARRRRAHR